VTINDYDFIFLDINENIKFNKVLKDTSSDEEGGGARIAERRVRGEGRGVSD
jgi:hypothetical protein